MMVLDQAIAELEVPPPDPGRWAGRLAEVAGQMRAVLGRHRDIVPSSIGLLAGDGRAQLITGKYTACKPVTAVVTVAVLPLPRDSRQPSITAAN